MILDLKCWAGDLGFWLKGLQAQVANEKKVFPSRHGWWGVQCNSPKSGATLDRAFPHSLGFTAGSDFGFWGVSAAMYWNLIQL